MTTGVDPGAPITRVGLVGCGAISRAYASTIARLPDLELIACADLDPARAQALATEVGIPLVLTPDALVEHPDVEVVLNLTIPVAHSAVSHAALAAGRHAYSEKPLALDVADARELVHLADRQAVRLGSAPDTFLGGGLQTCRGLLDSGALGAPIAATALMLGAGPESWHPSPQPFYDPGAGPLYDMGVYYVTALVHLLGPVRSVVAGARIGRDRRPITSQPLAGSDLVVRVPTHVAAVLEHTSGVLSTLVTSFDVPASRYHRGIEIHGADATLAVPDPNTFDGPVELRARGEDDWTDVPLTHPNVIDCRGLGLADMVRAARTGRAHRASGELALHVLEVLERILGSATSGHRETIEHQVDQPRPLPADLPELETGD